MDNKDKYSLAKTEALEAMASDAIQVAVEAHRSLIKQRFIIALLSFVCVGLMALLGHKEAHNE